MRRPPHYASTLLRQEEDNDTARGEEDTAVQEANEVKQPGLGTVRKGVEWEI